MHPIAKLVFGPFAKVEVAVGDDTDDHSPIERIALANVDKDEAVFVSVLFNCTGYVIVALCIEQMEL